MDSNPVQVDHGVRVPTITPTRLWWATNVTHLKTWQTVLCLGCIFVVSEHFRLGRCSEKVTLVCSHRSLLHYSITIKCLNFTIF